MPVDIDKDLRSSSPKFIIWLVIHTAVIVATACGFYFTLKGDIDRIIVANQGEDKYREERFRSIELNYALFEKQLDAIKLQIDALQVEVNEARTQQVLKK